MHHSQKPLIRLLDEAGIIMHKTDKPYKRIERLEYDGKVISCPRAADCFDVVKREFGVDLTTFND